MRLNSEHPITTENKQQQKNQIPKGYTKEVEGKYYGKKREQTHIHKIALAYKISTHRTPESNTLLLL